MAAPWAVTSAGRLTGAARGTRSRVCHAGPAASSQRRYTCRPSQSNGNVPAMHTDHPRSEPKFRHMQGLFESGRQDLNLRPPGPQPGALPDCATPRGRAKRATGIEPALEAWKASVQPQHFARTPAGRIPRGRGGGCGPGAIPCRGHDAARRLINADPERRRRAARAPARASGRQRQPAQHAGHAVVAVDHQARQHSPTERTDRSRCVRECAATSMPSAAGAFSCPPSSRRRSLAPSSPSQRSCRPPIG